jgi:saccharopine dehydrogenase-like NADP-dependent oxidoreductase
MRVLVLGGYGAVGAHVVTRLRARGAIAHVAGRDPRRADRVIDVSEPRSLTAALADVDVVVNCSGVEDAALIDRIASHGVAVVDITATTRYVEALERLSLPQPVMLSVGLAPGLTNLLAASVRAAAPAAVGIDLGIVLGAGEQHGTAGVAWTFDLLGRRFAEPATGEAVRNFTRPRRFALPALGRRLLYRADFSDQHTLTRDLGVPVRTYFGLDSRLATTALAALTWIPGASHGPRGLRTPGGDGWVIVAEGRDGTLRWATGRGQSRATAALTVQAAFASLRLLPGVHHLHHVLTLADLPSDAEITLGSAAGGPPLVDGA